MTSSKLRRWIIRFMLLLNVSAAYGQYFPKGSVDTGPGELKSQWYTKQLEALKEPSLLALSKNGNAECYRFLWLRSFNHPIAVRLEVRSDGTSVVTTKIATGAGGLEPGVLSQNSSKVIGQEQTHEFLDKVKGLRFWNAPNPVEDQKGTDGSQWIIEGAWDGRYHVVDRWTPTKGIARDLGLLLALDLAGITLPPSEIY